MTRRPVFLFFAALCLVGCHRAPASKDAIRDGVVEHLKKSGAIDLAQVDISVGDVKVEGNQAVAQVAFKPKASPQAGMTMSYTLERQGDKWQVKGRGAGHGGGAMGGGMGGGMGTQPPAPGAAGSLPSGHPPVNSPGGAGAATKGGDMPAGHPPVNTPPAPKK